MCRATDQRFLKDLSRALHATEIEATAYRRCLPVVELFESLKTDIGVDVGGTNLQSGVEMLPTYCLLAVI